LTKRRDIFLDLTGKPPLMKLTNSSLLETIESRKKDIQFKTEE